MSKKFLIYGLCHPEDKKIMYVGCTSKTLKERLKHHLRSTNGISKKEKWVKELLSNNIVPEIVKIDDATEENFEEKETYWIVFYNTINLLNATYGGKGSMGMKFSEESKTKLSEQRKNKKLSEHHRKRISESKMGEKNPNYNGKSMTEESKRKTYEKVFGKKRISHSYKLQGKKRNGSSSFTGVSFREKDSWESNCNYKGKQYYLGVFKTEIEAAEAYDMQILFFYGENAKLNFPEKLNLYKKKKGHKFNSEK